MSRKVGDYNFSNIEIINLHKRGLKTAEIAAQVGCTPATVLNHLRPAFGSIRKVRLRQMRTNAMQAAELYTTYHNSIAELCFKFKTTPTTIYKWLKLAGVQTRNAKPSEHMGPAAQPVKRKPQNGNYPKEITAEDF
jgi:transposase-like protein